MHGELHYVIRNVDLRALFGEPVGGEIEPWVQEMTRLVHPDYDPDSPRSDFFGYTDPIGIDVKPWREVWNAKERYQKAIELNDIAVYQGDYMRENE